MNKNIQGSIMLFLAALIWGSSFIVMKSAVDFLTPAILLSIRFVLASFFLLILFFKHIKTYPKDKIKGGLLTGCCLFVAYYVQTWGLSYTTPGKNAFLTAVYCAIVPFLVWFFYKKRPDIYHFLAAFLCVIGIGFVSLDGSLSMNIGDALTLLGGFLYAVHILMIQKYSKDVNSGAFTTLQFMGGAVVAIVVALLSEDVTVITQIQSSIYLQILYLAFFATAVTMVCQTIGQKYTSECNASLILSLESVFGVLFSILFYGEVLSWQVVVGFVLIFIAIIISETKLSFLPFKNLSKVFIVFGVLLSSFSSIDVHASESFDVKAPYAYVYDLSTNQVLYEKNANQKIYPASMTKVMTTLVALDHMDDLKKIVTIDNYDLKGLWEAGASTANLAVGEKVTYLDLLYGIILPSGADACRATSRVLFKTEEKMAEEMNKKAKELGLKNTHFMNATGLHHENHYTTVHDMAVITKTALNNPTFRKIFTSRSYRTETTGHYMAATILKVYWNQRKGISHILGCKTGYTKESKSCITCLVQSQNQDILCVFAKEDGSAQYVDDAKNVISYLDQNYHPLTVINKGEVLKEIQVKDGVKDSFESKALSNIDVFVRKDVSKDDIEVVYEGQSQVVAPTNENEELGSLKILYKDNVLKSVSIEMTETIEATDFAKVCRYIKENIVLLIGIIVLLILLIVSFILVLKKRKGKKRLAYEDYKANKK